MQSSAMNSLKVRLKTSSHSRALSRRGLGGTVPVSGRRSATVDNGEAAHLGLRLAFAAAAGEQAHRRADPAGYDEPRPERAGGDHGQPRAELARDVGHLADARTELVDGAGQPLALLLDVAPDLAGCAAVTRCHRSSEPRS